MVAPIWQIFLEWFGKIELIECPDIHSFLTFAWNSSFSSLLQRLWKIGVISLIWNIWISRNNVIFDDQAFSAVAVIKFLKLVFKETDDIKKLGFMDNIWSDYLSLRNLGVKSRPAPPPDYISVYWWPPDINWVKVNTDGSASGAPGLISAGGVFRNHKADVCGCFHIKGGSGFAFEAELLGVITAIAIAHNRGWRRLWLEADSSYVVNLLQNRGMDVPWRFRTYWKDTLRRLEDFVFTVTHIYREGNTAADIMAHSSRREGWWSNEIEEIKEAVRLDMSTHSYTRRI
ncbi:uncharacterized protein LOC131023373 [Salvia miltiorrhiza]|uniref:uncharacterized protein LOC131023373 n=1 Tax=Salvia miltiorrhiza TaxID=226208 RepID=UPI0025AC6BF9|nr:uncharacterized protein LOC131023373 [Salvia miltiorrhiza]